MSPPIPRLSSVCNSVCMVLHNALYHIIRALCLLHSNTLYPIRNIIDTDCQSGSFAVGEIVGATDLPQPKVNKCLIALVGRKAVGKSMVGVSDGLFFSGRFFSRWTGHPNRHWI